MPIMPTVSWLTQLADHLPPRLSPWSESVETREKAKGIKDRAARQELLEIAAVLEDWTDREDQKTTRRAKDSSDPHWEATQTRALSL
jgi:hypothetical protein